jgi:nucleoside-diphosphate kinase
MIPLSKAITNNYKRIFVIIKPGFIDKSQEILNIFKKYGWSLDMTTIKQLQLSEAKTLYAVHKNEDFYKDLCNYMSSGPSRAMILKKSGVLTQKTFDAVATIKNIIRDKWGESDMKNVLHSSDSYESMQNEYVIYFGAKINN